MEEITKNEMDFVLLIFKSPETDFNANSLSKRLGISSMGALKIARRLEKENIIQSKKLGNAKFYSINFDNEYAKEYIRFLLKRESEQSYPYIKVWIREIKKIKSANLAILFGSVLKKDKKARDIDVVLVTDKKNYKKLKKEVEGINEINIKKIHPIYQTKDDLKRNIKDRHKPILNGIKGVVVFGEDTFISSACA